jgi:hypothetical protein
MSDNMMLGANFRTHFSDKQTTISDTNETAISSPVGNVSDLYLLVINNRDASTDTVVTVRDGLSSAGGAVRWKGAVKAGFQAGFAMHPAGAMRQPVSATAWTAQCSVGVTAIEITAAFVKNHI